MASRMRTVLYAILAAGAVAVLLSPVVGHFTHETTPIPDGAGTAEMRIEGVRTVVYEENAVRLTASARAVEFEPARVLGPFRLGFVRSLVASDVEIELHVPPDDDLPSLDLAAYVKDAGTALARHVGTIAGAELRGVKITRRDRDGTTLTLLHARSCRGELGTRAMTCWKGVLHDGDRMQPFGEAAHDGRQWQITRAVHHQFAR